MLEYAGISLSMAKITIVYGSVGGNTELTCEKVTEVLEANGNEVSMLKAKLTDPATVKDFDLLILASPTYGHGQLEEYFEKFLNGYREVADLKGKKVAAISLGDAKYDMDYLLESAKIITKFFEEKEAQPIVDPLKIARSPLPHLETIVTKWAEKLVELL